MFNASWTRLSDFHERPICPFKTSSKSGRVWLTRWPHSGRSVNLSAQYYTLLKPRYLDYYFVLHIVRFKHRWCVSARRSQWPLRAALRNQWWFAAATCLLIHCSPSTSGPSTGTLRNGMRPKSSNPSTSMQLTKKESQASRIWIASCHFRSVPLSIESESFCFIFNFLHVLHNWTIYTVHFICSSLPVFFSGPRACPMRGLLAPLLHTLFCVLFHRFSASPGALWPSNTEANISVDREPRPFTIRLAVRTDKKDASSNWPARKS